MLHVSPLHPSLNHQTMAVLTPSGVQIIPNPPPLQLLSTTGESMTSAASHSTTSPTTSSLGSPSEPGSYSNDPTKISPVKYILPLPLDYTATESPQNMTGTQEEGLVTKRRKEQSTKPGSAEIWIYPPLNKRVKKQSGKERRKRVRITDELREEIIDFSNKHTLLKQGEVANIFGNFICFNIFV